jgi:hypothetical protein
MAAAAASGRVAATNEANLLVAGKRLLSQRPVVQAACVNIAVVNFNSSSKHASPQHFCQCCLAGLNSIGPLQQLQQRQLNTCTAHST